MEIIKLTSELNDTWNNFCASNPNAWFRHTTHFIDYIMNCRFDDKSKNLSFLVYQNKVLVAVVPLIIQSIYGKPELLEFAFTDTNTPYPCLGTSLSTDNAKQILKFIFEHINQLATEYNIVYARYFIEPLSDKILQSQYKINPLIYFDFIDTSISTSVINLNFNEDELLRNIRKGHKADIKFAEKQGYAVSIFDKNNITDEAFLTYKNMHFTAAGKKTRRDESWDIMYQWIKSGYAILALVKINCNGPFVGAAFVITSQCKAYYGSAAMDPSIDRMRGLGHLIQWEIIKYLKQNGFGYYDLGLNAYVMISQDMPSRKDLSISIFKSGFANETYPFFRGEQFYSEEYFKNVKLALVNEYCLMHFHDKNV